jgi:hypothetical protein
MKKNKLKKSPFPKTLQLFFFPSQSPLKSHPLQNPKQTLKIEVVASTTNYFGTRLFQTNIKRECAESDLDLEWIWLFKHFFWEKNLIM